MKVDLEDFIKATKTLHSRSVKRTRLQLKLRPHCRIEHRHRIFVLKVSDGKETYTTSIEHANDLKRVENLVNEFVTHCTEASVPLPASAAGPPPPSSTPLQQSQQQRPPPPPPQVNKKADSNVQSNNHNKKGGGEKRGKKGRR